MRLLIMSIFMIFAGCDERHSEGEKKFLKKFKFTPSILTEENPQRIQIITTHESVRSLKKILLLLPYEGRDTVVIKDTIKPIKFIVKMLERSEKFELRPKSALAGGKSYGIYLCQNNQCEIKHKFYIQNSPPQLIAHNLGSGEWPIITRNRIYYEFKFNQPIFIPDEDSVKLISHDNKDLEITKIMVRPTKQTIEIEIKPGQLEDQQSYYFLLKRVSNFDARETHFEQKFIVGRDELPLREHSPVRWYSSAREIELSWHLNNAYKAEVFFDEEEKNLNCLGGFCPIEYDAKSFSKNGFSSTALLSNLKPQAKYNIIIRARDHQGKVLLAKGIIETGGPSEITLSEIYINPVNNGSDAQWEFLEYINFSSHEKQLSNLRIIISDNLNNKYRECVLVEKEFVFAWPSQGYLLIVGADFKEENFNIPKNTKIIRLKQKTLCGGLADAQSKNIKLVLGENTMLDRYKGHLWTGENGKSIQKRDIKGLDEERNYCYSGAESGPSPGAPGDQC